MLGGETRSSLAMIPPEVWEHITLYLDHQSYDQLRMSFRNHLPLNKKVYLKEYQALEQQNALRSFMERNYNPMQLLKAIIYKQDHINLLRHSDLFNTLMDDKERNELFILLEAWPVDLLSHVEPVLVQLHQKGFLTDLSAIKLFDLLDHPILLTLIKDLLPTADLCVSLCTKNCVNTIKALNDKHKLIPDILQYPMLYGLMAQVLRLGHLGIFDVFKEYLAHQWDGEDDEINEDLFDNLIGIAIDDGYLEVLKFLVQQEKVAVETRFTLRAAVENEFEEVCMYVIERDMHLVDNYFLEQVIRLEWYGMFELLLENETDWNYFDLLEFLAQEHEDVFALKVLIKRKHPGLATQFIIAAIKSLFLQTVSTLMEELKFPAIFNLFPCAIETKCEAAVETLLKYHDIPGGCESEIVKNGFLNIVKSRKDKFLGKGDMLLPIAVRSGSVEMVKFFLTADRKVTFDSFEICLKARNKEILNLLLKHSNMDINDLGDILETAVTFSTEEMVDMLLNDVNLQECKVLFYDCAIRTAIALDRQNILHKLLEQRRMDTDSIYLSTFLLALEKNDQPVLKYFLHDGSFDPLTQNGISLKTCAKYGYLESLRFLLDVPACRNAVPLEELLAIALEHKQQAVIAFLSRQGVDYDKVAEIYCKLK